MLNKITDAQRENVRVTGLPDTPGLSTNEMQQRFDGLGNIAIDAINSIIDELKSSEGASNIITSGGTSVEEVIEYLNKVTDKLETNLTNYLSEHIVSVTELPSEPKSDVVYLIQGEVTVS